MRCPYCFQTTKTISNRSIGQTRFLTLECSHEIAQELLSISDRLETIESRHGHTLYPYQIEGIKFVQENNGQVLIADQQGLGKTIQAIISLVSMPDMQPAIVLCKSTLKTQWAREFLEWSNILPQIITSGNDFVLPTQAWIV